MGCIIGQDYPEPMLDLAAAGERNARAMREIRHRVLLGRSAGGGGEDEATPPLKAHCRPSNDEEICHFFWLDEENTARHPIKAN